MREAPAAAGVDAAAYRRAMLTSFYRDLETCVSNNFDVVRYNYDGVDRSGPDPAHRAHYLDWFGARAHEVFAVREFLADDASRELLDRLVRYRLAGHAHVRISDRIASLEDAIAIFVRHAGAGTPSRLPVGGAVGGLVHHDFAWNGSRYAIDTLTFSLAQLLVNEQYYFERADVRIAPAPGDVIIDAGCCTGETTAVFAQTAGERGHVYAFDPLASHVEICAHNFAEARNVSIVPYGVSDTAVDAPPVPIATYAPGFRAGATSDPVPMLRLDDFVAERGIGRVDFLKLDIEGSELAALRGARRTIERDRPKLALSIYHKPNDYVEIPNFVAGLDCGYRLYIDHHTIYDEETVLYAIAGSRPQP